MKFFAILIILIIGINSTKLMFNDDDQDQKIVFSKFLKGFALKTFGEDIGDISECFTDDFEKV